jgi:hypothetical protein
MCGTTGDVGSTYFGQKAWREKITSETEAEVVG